MRLMPKNQSKTQSRRAAKHAGMLPDQQMAAVMPPPARVKPKPFEPKNDRQRIYADAMRVDGNVVLGLGPAGTGKTYVAGSIASDLLQSKAVERIILTRPAVEAGGENLG